MSVGAWRVAEVRAAEDVLMARLPEGTLMQRAAAGLAARCVRLLGGAYGARVLLLVGAGNNGGDALYAGARLARRGARVDALLLNPQRVHAGGLADEGAFAAGELGLVLAEDDRMAAELAHAHLERDARARRRTLEDERHRTPVEHAGGTTVLL